MRYEGEPGLLPESGIEFRRKVYIRERYAVLLPANVIQQLIQEQLGDSAVLGHITAEIHENFVTNEKAVRFEIPVFLDVNPEHQEAAKDVVNRRTMLEAVEAVGQATPAKQQKPPTNNPYCANFQSEHACANMRAFIGLPPCPYGHIQR